MPINDKVHLRWPVRRMPLKVHLEPPPPSMASDPEAVYDAVRDGVTDWTDVAGPGLPSFVFVEDPADADIPIVWEPEPGGDWYIAHCVYEINPSRRVFGVARILVTTRWRRGEEPSLDLYYSVMLHEMGHAIGLTGHSPNARDIMSGHGVRPDRVEITARDRETLRKLYAKPNGARVSGARRFD